MPGTTPNRGYTFPTLQDPQDVRQAIEDLATDVDADMAAIHAGISLALNAPTVSVSRSSAQAVAPLTPTLVTWTAELYDNNASWEPIAPEEIVFQDTGIYWLTCSVGVSLTSEAPLRDGIVEFVSSAGVAPIPTSKSLLLDEQSPTYFSLMVPHFVLAAGETMSVRFTHDAVASLNVFNARLNVTRFAGTAPL